jgi:hypothetical protein
MPSPLIKSFGRAFAHGIWGELTDRVVELCSAGVTVLFLLLSSHFSWGELIEHRHKAFVAVVWLVSALITYHAFRAAYVVSSGIGRQERAVIGAREYSRIVAPSGEPIPIAADATTHYFRKVKLYGIASCLAALAFIVSYCVWADLPVRLESVGNLSFYEAPHIPLEYSVDFGTDVIRISAENLNEQFPFSRFLEIAGGVPLSIYISDSGEMKVSTVLYDRTAPEVGARMVNNEFTVLNHNWDRNWDNGAFEVVDEERNPIFQIERTRPDYIKIRGIFRTSTGQVIASTDKDLEIGPSKFPMLERLFQYPSAGRLHLRK